MMATASAPSVNSPNEISAARNIARGNCVWGLASSGACTACTSDAGEQQQDARQERDVAHARDVGEETRVDVLRGVDVDDLRDAGRNLLQGDFVAAGHTQIERQRDDDDARAARCR